MRIIIAVDLVLGPLLTLIVFKAGKPGLKFDLAVIGLFQSVCLIAGTWVVYQERPLFFVYYEDRFYSANADTFARYDQPVPNPARYSDRSPAIVAAAVPADPIEEADFRERLYKQGVPIWVYADSYEPLAQHMERVMSRGFPLEALQARDTEGRLEEFLAEHGGTAEDYLFLPAYSRYQNPFIAIRRADQQLVDILQVESPLAALPDADTPDT